MVDSSVFERIADSFTLGHYHTQKDFPAVQLLMSDGFKEYGQIPLAAHPLCWLHDEQPYRQLSPKLRKLERIGAEGAVSYRRNQPAPASGTSPPGTQLPGRCS